MHRKLTMTARKDAFQWSYISLRVFSFRTSICVILFTSEITSWKKFIAVRFRLCCSKKISPLREKTVLGKSWRPANWGFDSVFSFLCQLNFIRGGYINFFKNGCNDARDMFIVSGILTNRLGDFRCFLPSTSTVFYLNFTIYTRMIISIDTGH